MKVDRRAFLAAGSAAAASALIAAPALAQNITGQSVPGILSVSDAKGRRVIYRLSLRGRRGSRFAKRYNANMRFATKKAVVHAHRGDHSRIVPLTISVKEYRRLFSSRHSLVADLSKL